MNELLEWLVTAEDTRQPGKVKHLMKDIIAIVFFAELANANEWIEISSELPESLRLEYRAAEGSPKLLHFAGIWEKPWAAPVYQKNSEWF